MSYDETAQKIYDNIGGKSNINSLTHCVTRLRFGLKDESKANTDNIKNIDGVITVVKSGGQYQVVIGNAVTDVYNSFLKVSGFNADDTSSDESTETEGKKGLLNWFIDLVSGIFTPILPAMMAAGMVKGFNALFIALGLYAKTSGTYLVLQAAGDGFFYFLPVFLGYTAAKKFGLKPFIGMIIGVSLVYPDIVAATTSGKTLFTLFSGTLIQSAIHIKFLGIPVILMQYSSSVIPIIAATYLASRVEKGLKKIIPKMAAASFVPFFTILISIPLTFLIVGPIITWAGDFVGKGILAVYQLSPAITGMIIGTLWQVLVIFGLHWAIIPIAINNLSVFGYDPLLANTAFVSLATTGVVLAVLIKTHDKKLKSIALPALISAMFGISEPAIYGITLPRKKLFAGAMFSSGVAGLISGIFRSKMYIMGAGGIFSIPSFISPNGVDKAFIGYLISMATAFVLGFAITYLVTFNFYNKKETEQSEPKESESTIEINTPVVDGAQNMFDIDSPLKGDLKKLTDLQDEVFSKGLLGKGFAVTPKDGKIYAPFDGTIDVLFPTKHAIGIESNTGVKLMIHVGMDTVNLKGKYFTAHVKQGDSVKKGDLLLEFDVSKIKAAGYVTDTPVIVTDTDKYLDVIPDFNQGELHVIL